MNAIARAAGLPLAAAVLVAGVLVTQVANGGGSFEPLQPADACAARPAPSAADDVDGLTENLVLLGVNNAACDLGVSREALILELAQPGERSDAQIDALRDGLHAAVDQLDADGALPPASTLADEVLETADLNGFVKGAIRLLPDSAIDAALKTDDVLDRAIDDLDLRELLTNIDSEDELNQQVESAVTDAVKASLLARLRGLLP